MMHDMPQQGSPVQPVTQLPEITFVRQKFSRFGGGELILDRTIQALLERGRSLLPAGITAVSGEFGIGDPVRCTDPAGAEVARGLVAYSAQEVARIRGLSTRQIEAVLG